MLELNLDPHFSVGMTNTIVEHQLITFPGGEPHIKIVDPAMIKGRKVMITHRIDSFNKMGELLVAIDAVKRLMPASVWLFIPYFPGARQDRVANPGEALTAKVYADLINQSGVDNITILDPHSDVSPALFSIPCLVVNNHDFIARVMLRVEKQEQIKPVIIAPDAGAIKKSVNLTAALAEDGQHYQLYNGAKRRDTKTGNITGFEIHADDLQEQPCVIVDDICDGGGTFLGLAKELKKKNAGNLYLAITHGIFSKGLESMFSVFEQIYTTDSVGSVKYLTNEFCRVQNTKRLVGTNYLNIIKIKDI